MDHVGIETSRHIRLSYTPAPLFDRILAWVTDALLYVIYVVVFMWVWGGIVPSEIIDNLNVGWIQMLAIFLPYFIYFPVVETVWNGRTVGKKLAGIRVIRIDGTRASLGSYLIRWLFRFFEITSTGGVVAILTILINGKGQRLGDLVANTCVISERARKMSGRQLFNQTNQNRQVVFKGASELSDDDINILKQLINSRRDYSSSALKKMMKRSRRAIETKTGASGSDLSDEEFLRTIIRDYNTIYGETRDDSPGN